MAGLSAKRPAHMANKRNMTTKKALNKAIKKKANKTPTKKSIFAIPTRQMSVASVHIDVRGPKYQLNNKESTLIAGLDVVPNGREVLESLYLHTIDLSKQYHTKTNQFLYRSIENLTTYRLNVLRKFPQDDLQVERIIGAGQIEELIEQAEEELMLMDMLNNTKERPINEDIMKAHAPAFSRDNAKSESRIYPLPDEVAFEVATGKVSVLPYHPTKPLSRKFRQHLGFGDEITAEEHAEYDKIMEMTEDEKAAVAKKLKETNVMDFIRQDYEDCLLINKKEKLSEGYYEWFNTNTAAFPETDVTEIARLTAMHEGSRKL